MNIASLFGAFKIREQHDADMELARKLARDMARKKSVLIDLIRETESLTKKDVGTWHQGWQMAIDHEEPRRSTLYDCYSTALIDAHLTGCITQRKGRTQQKDFIIKGKDGKENEQAKRYFENEWFTQFVDFALDAENWGHSLIQFGDILHRGSDAMRFENCVLVPRKHVVPEYGVITQEIDGDIKRGWSFREGELADWCVEVGDPYDLGLLLKITPQCISKKICWHTGTLSVKFSVCLCAWGALPAKAKPTGRR